MTLTFFASGLPKGQPRVRATRRGKFAGVYDPGTADRWKSNVREAASQHMPPAPFAGPVRAELVFTLPRPKAHFLKAGLRANAPLRHISTPDADNLAKAVLDALGDMQAFWADDSQVCELRVSKLYGERAGCWVKLEGMK